MSRMQVVRDVRRVHVVYPHVIAHEPTLWKIEQPFEQPLRHRQFNFVN
jgi:hypothetical protein